MSNWLWVLMLASGAYLGGVGTGWPLLQHVAYALLLVDVLGLAVVRMGAHGLSVSRTADRSAIQAGDDVLDTVSFEKASGWPALRVVVDDGTDDPVALSVWGGATRRIFRKHPVGRRGRYEVGAADVVVQDPFGLFSFHVCRLDPITITVYPRPIEVPQWVLARRSAATGQHRWRSGEAEATLGDLRGYVPGDPPSRIHWRSTARTGTLMVSEPEVPRARAIWLLVDLSGGEEAADRTAGMAAYLVDRLLATNQEVGAIVAGLETEIVPPGRGWEQSSRLLLPLATISACAASQIDRVAVVAARVSKPGSFVVLSPSSPADLALRRLRRIAEVVTMPGVGD